MKTIKNILWLATLPLAFTACQDEDIVNNNQTIQNKDMYTLHCVMQDGTQGRAYVQTGNTDVENEFAVWSREDKFVLYDHTDITDTDSIAEPVSSIFNISTDYWQPSNAAEFTSNRALTDGSTVTAIYPVQTGAINEGKITLQMPDYAHYTLPENNSWEWETYMKQNMFMYATATVEGVSTTLQFQHLCSLARITYTNMTDKEQQISSCILSGNGSYFGEGVEMDVKTGAITAKPFVTTIAGIHFENLTVAPSKSCDIYMLFFPGEDFAENGTLTFSVDTLATAPMATADISANNSGAKGFEAGKRYWFNVAQTEEGLSWVKDMPEKLITNKRLIEILENYYGKSFTKDENGYINVYRSYEQLCKVSSINILFDTISTLKGIEYLPNLEYINCVNCFELSHLDVSKNLKLKELHCTAGEFTQIDVSKNTALTKLNISNNPLTSIDVSNNESLTELQLFNNQLTELDLSKNTNLTHLNVGENELSEIDLSKNTGLTYIEIGGNKLAEIDLSNNTKLMELYCSSSSIEQLDLADFKDLEVLHCDHNKIKTLNLNNNINLKELNCRYNDYLTTLEISQLTLLEKLDCWSTSIEKLELENLTSLIYLDCGNTQITTLDVTHNTQLEELHCLNNTIYDIDVSNNKKLSNLNCQGCSLTQLDLSNNTLLESLTCIDNQLPQLDISKNTNLKSIYCGRQKNINAQELTLILTLNEDQRSLWTNNWKNSGLNENVVLYDAVSTNEGADFGNGGIY